MILIPRSRCPIYDFILFIIYFIFLKMSSSINELIGLSLEGTPKSYKGRRNNNDIKKWENETDLYETNEKAILAIYDFVISKLPNFKEIMFYEPAMGNGRIINVLKSKGIQIYGNDKFTQGHSVDYLTDIVPDTLYDFIITNPPFNKATEFLKKMYESAKPFLLLLPFDYLSTISRYSLFHEYGVIIYILFPKPRFTKEGKEIQVASSAWYYGNSGRVTKGEILVKHCYDETYGSKIV